MISERMAKKFCCEDIRKIENYEKAVLDKINVWVCHHKNGVSKDLKSEGLYYHRPASELMFMTREQHTALHHHGFRYSDEAIEKLRKASLGNKRALGYKHTDEQRKKNSEAKSGEKNPFYGMHWYTDGINNIRAHECPKGYVQGRRMK